MTKRQSSSVKLGIDALRTTHNTRCLLLVAVFLLFTIYFSLFADVAFAAGAEKEYGFKYWFWQIANFAILALVLVVFLRKPLKTYFQQRKELIEKSIREAQEAKELARKALAEVEERLKLKDKEVEDIITFAKSSGEREKERLIEEGERLKVKILKQAKTNIDYEVKRAKEAIKAEAVEAAMELAEEQIKTRLTKDDQEKLLAESLKLINTKN